MNGFTHQIKMALRGGFGIYNALVVVCYRIDAGRAFLPSTSSLCSHRIIQSMKDHRWRRSILIFLATVTLFSMYSHPLTTLDISFSETRNKEPTIVTIYITNSQQRPNPAESIFHTDSLERFGTGNVQYIVNDHADCTCREDLSEEMQQNLPELMEPQTPCLAVARHGQVLCDLHKLKCRYPQCKTFITNDEDCIHMGHEGRQYFTRQFPNKAYLPLGPRLESWQSFRRIGSLIGGSNFSTTASLSTQLLAVPRASQRKYAANAIYSESTSSGRKHLHDVITNNKRTKMDTFVQISPKWNADINDPRNSLLDSHHYAQVLLNSTFTLAPFGHNPECFRLYEAVS